MAKKEIEWVSLEVEMSPQTLDVCLREGLLQAEVNYRLTEKGIKSLKSFMNDLGTKPYQSALTRVKPKKKVDRKRKKL